MSKRNITVPELDDDTIQANGLIRIEKFIVSVMALYGLKKQKDFVVSNGQLLIRKDPVRGKLIHVLKHYYPQYSYYWETPKMLKWF